MHTWCHCLKSIFALWFVFFLSFFFIFRFAGTNESHVFPVSVQVLFTAVHEILKPYFKPAPFKPCSLSLCPCKRLLVVTQLAPVQRGQGTLPRSSGERLRLSPCTGETLCHEGESAGLLREGSRAIRNAAGPADRRPRAGRKQGRGSPMHQVGYRRAGAAGYRHSGEPMRVTRERGPAA